MARFSSDLHHGIQPTDNASIDMSDIQGRSGMRNTRFPETEMVNIEFALKLLRYRCFATFSTKLQSRNCTRITSRRTTSQENGLQLHRHPGFRSVSFRSGFCLPLKQLSSDYFDTKSVQAEYVFIPRLILAVLHKCFGFGLLEQTFDARE